MAITKEKIWTYNDYYNLSDDKRYEVIEGELIEMYAPRIMHQEILVNLTIELGNYLKKNKIGKIYIAPCDVVLSDINTFQPDLLFVSQENLNIIKEKAIIGTPDLIIEILSPSNKAHDMVKKFKLYEKFKVKELWIIDPDDKSIKIYSLKADKLALYSESSETTKVKSTLLRELDLSFADLV